MILNEAGGMIDKVCREITEIIPNIYLDVLQIMLNHFHGIIVIDHTVGAGLRACPGRPQRVAPTGREISLSEIVGRFKSITTYRYIEGVNKHQWIRFDGHLWQRNYYEHVIRDKRDYQAIADYIISNPMNWHKDEEYPY